MKVLFLNYEYPPLGGGAAVATEALMSEWAKQGRATTNQNVSVHLVTSSPERGYHTELCHSPKVCVSALNVLKGGKGLHKQGVFPIAIYTLRALISGFSLMRRERPDVILAFFTLPCGFVALILSKIFGVPYVVSLRGADVPGFTEKFPLITRFGKPFTRLIWQQAQAVVPNSSGLLDLARRTLPDLHATIIPNGVDTVRFAPAPALVTAPFTLLSLARLTKRKRIDLVIEALALLPSPDRSAVQFLVAGDGEELGKLQALAHNLGLSDVVRFLGRVEHDSTPALYRQASALILVSENEGMSNNVLEGVASGLPIIATRTGGMTELIRDGVNGMLVPVDTTAQALSDIIQKLIHDTEALRQMGAESRTEALGRSWANVAAQFTHTLQH
jgi:glycogen(starch) synthase